MQSSSTLVRATFIWLSASANFWKNFLHTLEINISLQTFNTNIFIYRYTRQLCPNIDCGEVGGGGEGGCNTCPAWFLIWQERVWHLWPLGVRTVESTYTGCSFRTMPSRGHQNNYSYKMTFCFRRKLCNIRKCEVNAIFGLVKVVHTHYSLSSYLSE